jgi:dihydrofolate synthase/folylpolyglutamate synthase
MAMTYAEAVQWYYSFARFDTGAPALPDSLKLARVEELLARLGNPHTAFPAVLIAGTKGKGSTAALVASILHAAGLRVGLFTSPHLHSFRERIRVNGEMISKVHVVQGTTLLQTHAAEFSQAKFFEWVTALAFDYFARQRVEIGVIEVGLGGRFDCTNVLTPRVSVITSVSLDHMDILGDTLEKIAYEKAGIIKPGIPVIVAPQAPEALSIISDTAHEKDAPLVSVADAYEWEMLGTSLDAQVVRVRTAQEEQSQTYHLPLLGPHQRVNLVTALATINALRDAGWKIPQGALARGIERVDWKGRFEILARPAPPFTPARPAAETLSDGTYVVADGAHNRASARELVRTLDEVFPNLPVHFIFGASSDKDIRGMLDELIPRAASLVVTRSHHARAADPFDLARLASPHLLPLYTTDTFVGALLRAKQLAAPGDVICATGSLFISAEAREHLLAIPPDDPIHS